MSTGYDLSTSRAYMHQHISVARGGAYSAWASFVFLLVSGFAKTLESVKAKELHAFLFVFILL